MASVVLTVIGDDRPGLVDSLAAVIDEHGGNWEESRMAHLANKFAGILLVRVADAKADQLLAALQTLDTETHLHITAEFSKSLPETQQYRTLQLELIGQDHTGIVHDIAHALAGQGISIEELTTETQSASMAGGTLFQAQAQLKVPYSVVNEQLRDVLESLANELMVDITLDETLL